MTHNHSRRISSEVIAYRELTTRLHLHHKPVRNAKPHDGSCQMMGLVFSLSLRSSMTILSSSIVVYIHAVVQREDTSVLSLSFVLSHTVHGECFPRKRRVEGQSAVLRNISRIFLHLVLVFRRSHLLGLSHLWIKTEQRSEVAAQRLLSCGTLGGSSQRIYIDLSRAIKASPLPSSGRLQRTYVRPINFH